MTRSIETNLRAKIGQLEADIRALKKKKPKTTRELMVSSDTDRWYSPERVLIGVRRFGQLVLDPWWGPGCRTCPLVGIDEKRDSLTYDWVKVIEKTVGQLRKPGYLDCYSNHPYSKSGDAIPKLVREARRGLELISLVKSATSEAWFKELVWDTANAVCFFHGRLKHDIPGKDAGDVDNTAQFPSALVYHGQRKNLFAECFEPQGKVLWLR